MSASLVGSEMCIRDSCSSRAWAGPHPWSRIQAMAPAAWAASARPRGEPVSYTHLTLPTICSV
eukprot:10972819-Alexandrium_andersonii.AAC.1